MCHHDEHRAGDTYEVQAGNTQENETHVRHAGITNQEVQILLAHRHPADIQDVADAEPGDNVRPVLGRLRQERQGDADQTVETEFLEHAGMQHGGGRRRHTITQRRPGMERPERNQDAETE